MELGSEILQMLLHRNLQERMLLGNHELKKYHQLAFFHYTKDLCLPIVRLIGTRLKTSKVKLKFLDESIRLAAFYDFGWFGDRYADYDSDYLMSVGGGLVLKLTKYMSGNVYFGVPVGKKPEDASNMRVHFTVTSNIL